MSTASKMTCACVIAIVALVGCKKQVAAPSPDVVILPSAAVPVEPSDAAWNAAPEHVAKLIPQDLVEPRQIVPTTPEVRVRAISSATELALRLEWADTSDDNLSLPAMFADACAVQLPTKIEPNVPAPQMGEPGKPVEITFWNASWQATVNGRGDSIKDLYPNASIDHYPYEAQSLEKGSPAQLEMQARYSPARSLGNALAGPRDVPVQDMTAEGPGTLTPNEQTVSKGKGIRTPTGWSVVIVRPLPKGWSNQSRGQIALAVWQGAAQEVGARKMRTGWIPLSTQATP